MSALQTALAPAAVGSIIWSLEGASSDTKPSMTGYLPIPARGGHPSTHYAQVACLVECLSAPITVPHVSSLYFSSIGSATQDLSYNQLASHWAEETLQAGQWMHDCLLDARLTFLLRSLTEQALHFLGEHRLHSDLVQYVRLALEHFQRVVHISAKLERDPVDGDEWVALDVQVAGDTEDILHSYDQFTDASLDTVPNLSANFLRLCLDVVEA